MNVALDLTKMHAVRLLMILAVSMAALEAFLFGQGGMYDRVDDTVVGGLTLAMGIWLLQGVTGNWTFALAFTIITAGVSLLLGLGFWPWDWMFSWMPWPR